MSKQPASHTLTATSAPVVDSIAQGEPLPGLADTYLGVAAGQPWVVRIAAPRALAEIDYGSDILRDHMLFLNLGINSADPRNAPLKKEAARLLADWSKFRTALRTDVARQELHRSRMQTLRTLVADTARLKGRVLAAIESGQVVGALFASFLKELIYELALFVLTLEGRVDAMSLAEIVRFFNWHGEGHSALTATDIDPLASAPQFAEALHFAEHFRRLQQADPSGAGEMMRGGEVTSLQQLAVLSIQSYDGVDRLLDGTQQAMQQNLAGVYAFSNRINPQMVEHWRKENVYGAVLVARKVEEERVRSGATALT